MRRLLFLAVFAFAVSTFAACKKEPAAPPPARTTPMAPDQPMGIDKPDRARVELDLANARAAVRTISGVNGSPPKSLQEMNVSFSYPADLSYDPATGMVKSKTYPSL